MDRLAADLVFLGTEVSLTCSNYAVEPNVKNKGTVSSPSYTTSVNSLCQRIV